MDLNLIQEEFFKLIPDATDQISSDFDFKNNIAIGVKIGNNILEKGYCKEIDLEIRVTSLINKKMEIQERAKCLDKIINNYVFKTIFARIVRENVYYSSFYDDEHFNIVLMYTIKKY